jgi:hypothetical protein
VEEVDQVEEVQEEVSYTDRCGVESKLRFRTRRTTKSRRKRRTRARSTKRWKRKGPVREVEGKGKEIILSQGPISSLSILCRQLRECGWPRVRMGMFVG